MKHEYDYSMQARAEVILRQKYLRMKPSGVQEKYEDMLERTAEHDVYLWQRQIGRELNAAERTEIADGLYYKTQLMWSSAGRVNWLGGTAKSKEVEVTSFNCSLLEVHTPNNAVNALWLLLQGCGVSVQPRTGGIFGFAKYIHKISVIRSTRIEKGRTSNVQSLENGVWTISVGDSAVAWAEAFGLLLTHQFNGVEIRATELILDFSNIRGAGQRTSGYQWKTSGDQKIADSYMKIATLLNNRVQSNLSAMDIIDVVGLSATILSSRRSAALMQLPYDHAERGAFIHSKDQYWANPLTSHRYIANHSLLLSSRPTLSTLRELLQLIYEGGGSEPGFINLEAAQRRFVHCKGVNPCGEQLLDFFGLCNQVEINTNVGTYQEQLRVAYLAARVAYRQTLVKLNDGILDPRWALNNERDHHIGAGITGIVQSGIYLRPGELRGLRQAVIQGANDMADELGLGRSATYTSVKPSGTLGKAIFMTTEGTHHPVAQHLINYVNFAATDPVVPLLESHGHEVRPNPHMEGSVIIGFPIYWQGDHFKWHKDEFGINMCDETAIDQLNRYQVLIRNYSGTSVSSTITFTEPELDDMSAWIYRNWDDYVSTAFMLKYQGGGSVDSNTYLPQTPVTASEYEKRMALIKPIDWDNINLDRQCDRRIAAESDSCKDGQCSLDLIN